MRKTQLAFCFLFLGVATFIATSSSTSAESVSTGYKTDGIVDLIWAAEHFGYSGPAEMQKAGVQAIKFFNAVAGITGKECDLGLSDSLNPVGPYMYESIWSTEEVNALEWVADHYCITKEQAQLYGGTLFTFFAGLDSSKNGTNATRREPPPPSINVVMTTTTAPTTTTTEVENENWIEELLSLLVVDNASAPVDYDRDDWGSGWSDDDGDCINTRHEVLLLESLGATSLSSSGCSVSDGEWYAAFTGTYVTNPSSLDVDHFVPLANAHDSGGWAWSSATKKSYYNDLVDPQHLIAVTASANRSKGSRGPEEWKPSDSSHWCQYADSWADIKIRWALTATSAEFSTLQSMLGTCDGQPTGTYVPPVSTSTTTTTTTTLVQNPGDTKNCSDFSTYAEAMTWFFTYWEDYGDVAGLDNDGDGQPCESLPGGPAPTSTTIAPTTTTSGVPDNPGNSKNCSDFSTYTEAKTWFDIYFPHYGDVARLDGDDGDNDGEPCESLPGGP